MNTPHPKSLWICVVILLLLVMIYNLYSGITIHRIGIPGVLEIEFDSSHRIPESRYDHTQDAPLKFPKDSPELDHPVREEPRTPIPRDPDERFPGTDHPVREEPRTPIPRDPDERFPGTDHPVREEPRAPVPSPRPYDSNEAVPTGRLPGDTITACRLLEKGPGHAMVEIDYSFNPQHGSAVSIRLNLLSERGCLAKLQAPLSIPQGQAQLNLELAEAAPCHSRELLIAIGVVGHPPFVELVVPFEYDWEE